MPNKKTSQNVSITSSLLVSGVSRIAELVDVRFSRGCCDVNGSVILIPSCSSLLLHTTRLARNPVSQDAPAWFFLLNNFYVLVERKFHGEGKWIRFKRNATAQ